MKKLALVFILILAMALAAGCSKPPDAERAAAKAAVAAAQAAGTAANCPDKLKAAEDELAKAEAQYAAKEYDACKLTSAETIKLAEIAKACKPKEVPPPPPPPAKMETTAAPVYFDYNKYNIRPDQLANAKAAAETIKKHGTPVVILGNCDESGSEEHNIALGMKRAKAIWIYLGNNGVDKKTLSVKSLGESKPADPSNTKAAWAKNRRVEFQF